MIWDGDNILDVIKFIAPLEPLPIKGFINSDDIFGLNSVDGFMVVLKGARLEKVAGRIKVHQPMRN